MKTEKREIIERLKRNLETLREWKGDQPEPDRLAFYNVLCETVEDSKANLKLVLVG